MFLDLDFRAPLSNRRGAFEFCHLCGVIFENIMEGLLPLAADIASGRFQHGGKTGFYMPDVPVDVPLIWERVAESAQSFGAPNMRMQVSQSVSATDT